MDEIEEIKRRLDIVDFISTYLTLKKAGSNYKAICPFHQEKTPSFMVSSEKQIWHCFGGCSEGGDIFTFLMKMENMEFPEALRMLAERAGVQLKRRTFKPEEGRDRKTQLYKINDWSAKVFHKILISHPAGKNALEYLKKRGINIQTIKDFMIGYAPSAKILESFLIKKGFKSSEIQEAGAPNRFFKRIMFPIRDAMGNTIAFTGRATQEGQEPAGQTPSGDSVGTSPLGGAPKYLNTADTIIFHKGQILYNLNQARGPIKQTKATIVVEGQMDVTASHQAGVKNVVASSGTALTDEHLKILYRYTPNIIFAFDSDTAGLATAKKAYEMAIVLGFNVKMVSLGKYKDPGEMIAADPELWQKAVSEATPVIDWYFELAFKKKIAENKELTSQEKKEIAKEILPIIKIIPDQIEQAHYVNLLAKRLAVNEDVVFDALVRAGVKKEPGQDGLSPRKKMLSPEELLLAILIYSPVKIKAAQEKVNLDEFKNPIHKTIYNALKKEYNISSKGTLERVKKQASRETKVYIDNLYFEGLKLYESDQSALDEDLRQSLAHLTQDKKEALKAYYAEEIKKAESAKDKEKLKKLIKEFQDAISKK